MHRRRFLRSTALATLGLSLPSAISLASDTSLFHPPPASTASIASTLASSPVTLHLPSAAAQWIGHSTILFRIDGTTVLCDPVLFREIGLQLFGSTVGLRRYSEPAIRVENIAKPDIVLLSHAHMDHMDRATLEALCARFPDEIDCVCASNTKDVIDDLAWRSCRELDWWESLHLHNLSICAIEVLHNGWRYPWEADRREGAMEHGRSYNAYLISGADTNVVFAGDTTYCESFRDLRHIPIHLACMPIGAYMGCADNHCTPEQAVQMATMMQAQCVAPMHCLTFHQTPEPDQEPIARFQRALRSTDASAAWLHIGSQWTRSQPIAQGIDHG